MAKCRCVKPASATFLCPYLIALSLGLEVKFGEFEFQHNVDISPKLQITNFHFFPHPHIAADDELTFDPGELITNIEMAST